MKSTKNDNHNDDENDEDDENDDDDDQKFAGIYCRLLYAYKLVAIYKLMALI